MICIPDTSFIAIADIENNLSLYDLNTPKLDKALVIKKLPGVITCMNYKYILFYRMYVIQFLFNLRYFI
jgi:hypothetical protein